MADINLDPKYQGQAGNSNPAPMSIPLPHYLQEQQRLEAHLLAHSIDQDTGQVIQPGRLPLHRMPLLHASPSKEVWARWDRWKERLKIVPAPEPKVADVPYYILHEPEFSGYLRQSIDESHADELAGRIPLLDDSNPVEVHERFVYLLEKTEDKIVEGYRIEEHWDEVQGQI